MQEAQNLLTYTVNLIVLIDARVLAHLENQNSLFVNMFNQVLPFYYQVHFVLLHHQEQV